MIQEHWYIVRTRSAPLDGENNDEKAAGEKIER
jgi:hypothetical protein